MPSTMETRTLELWSSLRRLADCHADGEAVVETLGDGQVRKTSWQDLFSTAAAVQRFLAERDLVSGTIVDLRFQSQGRLAGTILGCLTAGASFREYCTPLAPFYMVPGDCHLIRSLTHHQMSALRNPPRKAPKVGIRNLKMDGA